MQVTIDIPYGIIGILRSWASVQRTINTAKEGLEVAVNKTDDVNLKEKYNWCISELDMIGQPLDSLHRIVRDQIWLKEIK